MRSRLVLFDFDYTLVDASECLFSAIRAGLRAVGANSVSDSRLRFLIGIPLEEQFAVLTNSSDHAPFQTFSKAYVSERRAKEVTGTALISGADVSLAKLKRSGILLGIVSRGAEGRISRALTRFNMIQLFDRPAILTGYKQKSEGIRKAMTSLNKTPSETLYVGDRPDDGDSAVDAGVAFIGVTTGAYDRQQFTHAVAVLNSVADLPDYLTGL